VKTTFDNTGFLENVSLLIEDLVSFLPKHQLKGIPETL